MDYDALIGLVEGHPILYNTKHVDYVKPGLKDDAYQAIATELGLKAAVVKEMWTKLRDSHREALRRQKIKFHQKGELSRPWKYQKQMEYLIPFMKPRNTTINMDTWEVDDSDEESKFITINDHNSSNRYSETADDETENIVDSLAAKRRKTRESCSASDDIFVKDEVETEDINEEISEEIFMKPCIQQSLGKCEQQTKSQEELRQTSLENKTNDPLYAFFVAMYMATKQLPSVYQRKVRNNIFQVINQEEENYEFDKSTNKINAQTTSSASANPSNYMEQNTLQSSRKAR